MKQKAEFKHNHLDQLNNMRVMKFNSPKTKADN